MTHSSSNSIQGSLLSSKPAKPGNDEGFALVISLALLSFLFLLVLALVTLVGVEARVADSRQEHALAKAHAKMALYVAIGELQKHAGPDQRVTATAAILDANTQTPEIDGVEQPHWTGVWRRNPAIADDPPTLDPDMFDTNWDSHPEMQLAWLVSGNESGKIEDSAYLDPNHPNLPKRDSSEAMEEYIWLVDKAVASSKDRVVVKKSTISYSNSTESSGATAGAYAYWVGDEGVKTKFNVPDSNQNVDPKADFLLNQNRFAVSPGPRLDLAEHSNSNADAGVPPADLDEIDLERARDSYSLPELRFAYDGGTDDETKTREEALKDYFHDLTPYSYGVLADVLRGGLKRDLTAGLGDDEQFSNHLEGYPMFKDKVRYLKDYDPNVWGRNWGVRWNYGFIDERRWLAGPPWDMVRSYYKLFEDVNFDASDPLQASVQPRSTDSYPNRNAEFWTEEYNRVDPTVHSIAPVLMEAKVVHALEMDRTDSSDADGNPLYQPRIAIFPSLSLWNPYNVELAEASYELVWKPDCVFWVYDTLDRVDFANAVMQSEASKNVSRHYRWWDRDMNSRITNRSYSYPHPNPPKNRRRDFRVGVYEPHLLVRAHLGRHGRPGGPKAWRSGVTYSSKKIVSHNGFVYQALQQVAPGTEPGADPLSWQPLGASPLNSLDNQEVYLRATQQMENVVNVPNLMSARRIHLYHNPITDSRFATLAPIRLRTNPVRLAPGEKLYFTLAENGEFLPGDGQTFLLTNHLSFKKRLYFNIPPSHCPPVPADHPVSLVYDRGNIHSYHLGEFQRQNPEGEEKGTTLYMWQGGQRVPITKINFGFGGAGRIRNRTFQDYGRADIVVPDASRSIGPSITQMQTTRHWNPRPLFLEHNPRALVHPWHLGKGSAWTRGQESDFQGGAHDTNLDDDVGVVFDLSTDETLSGDFYSDGSGRYYYGYLGHSFDVAGFHRVRRNGNEEQWLPASSRAVFYDVPRQPLVSLGSLQHVNLGYFGNSPAYCFGNSYASGLISRHRKWSPYNQMRALPYNYSGLPRRGGNEHQNTMIDYSYYANEGTWDGFFFSTVPTRQLQSNASKYPPFSSFDQTAVDSGQTLPNSRMRYFNRSSGAPRLEELRDFNTAAANLMVDGAFNLNSTSVEAWKAQLGSLSQKSLLIRDLQDDYQLVNNGKDSTTLSFDDEEFPFPRLSVSMGQGVNPESGDLSQDFWTGFASLNADQLHRLSEEIVQEVKERGPFLSMSDFVNRRLVNPPGNTIFRQTPTESWPEETTESRQGLRGALQAAIHDAGINDGGFREQYNYTQSPSYDIIPQHMGQFSPFGFVTAAYSRDLTNHRASQVRHNRVTHWGGGPRDKFLHYHDKLDPNTKIDYRPDWEHRYGEAPENLRAARNLMTGALMPGWLSQADVLTALAPVANVRSDTFRIRAYGEAPNNPDVRVWCEAIVQRIPDYVIDQTRSGGDTPQARPSEPYDDSDDSGTYGPGEAFTDYDFDDKRGFYKEYYNDQPIGNLINEQFGRQFHIVQFRWLSPDEV